MGDKSSMERIIDLEYECKKLTKDIATINERLENLASQEPKQTIIKYKARPRFKKMGA